MKKIAVKDIYFIFITVFGLMILGIGSSYAVFTSSSEISSPITFVSNLGSDTDIFDTTSVTVGEGEVKTFIFNINNNLSSSVNYSFFTNYSGSDVLFGIKTNMGGNAPSGVLTSGSSGKVYVMVKNNSTSSKSIFIGIASSTENIVLDSDMTIIPNKLVTNTFGDVITNLYNNGSKKTVTNNGNSYQYDIDHNLMKDNDNNIRYYGASPDNYVYFNCDDYSNQSDSTCEKWRIIGVFDGKVKIMRSSTIGTYAWDNKDTLAEAESDNGKNEWTEARLMKLLNPGYESEEDGGSLYYNAGSGNCYSGQNNRTEACDFTTTGLKNDETRGLISESMWYLKGWKSVQIFSDQIYNYERTTGSVYTGRKTSWTGKVALPYPSDYGYAADFNQCTVALGSYNDATCTGNNWMKSIITNNGGSVGWLLTPYSGNSYYAWDVRSSGDVGYGGSDTCDGEDVVPTLYLNFDLEMVSGTGKIDNPYRLSVE